MFRVDTEVHLNNINRTLLKSVKKLQLWQTKRHSKNNHERSEKTCLEIKPLAYDRFKS